MKTITVEKQKRELKSILTSAEAAGLKWFAARMPSWVNSDHLTLLGLAGMALAGVFYYLSQWNPLLLHVVNLWIVVNWFGDSLDGTLARYRNRLRPRYGYYVDHILDNFGVLFLTAGMALSGYISPWVATAVLISYLLLNINIYLATSAVGVFKISFGIFGPTELRALLIVGNLILIGMPTVEIFGKQMLFFDVGGIVAASSMFVILIISTILNTRKLYCLERL
jgi:archaetidylinositol phosphate synthase